MQRLLLYLFILFSVGELTSTVIEIPYLHEVCKPALLIVLGMYYFSVQRNSENGISVLLLIALFFSWLGDVLLMNTGDLFFMLGLGSFLLSHIVYIFVYRQHKNVEGDHEFSGLRKLRAAFPVILSGTGLVVILYPYLGELRLPVMTYALVITLMTLNALFRFGKTSSLSFGLVFFGAILFMISDSLLAINKFIEPLAQAHFWIMLTYIGAQFCIVTGLIRHK